MAITPTTLHVTAHLRALIDPADPSDPIARQFLPSPLEAVIRPEEDADPIGDAVHGKLPGVVHRYPDRALLLPVLTCAAYCRFCFRRETVNSAPAVLDDAALSNALAYFAATEGLREVILSGGDPLVLPPTTLAHLMARLDAIPRLTRLRVHTRTPISDPRRIDAAMADALAPRRLPVRVVVHVNHPRELDPSCRAALARLREAGISLLAQSVLLRGVNDRPETLAALGDALEEAGVEPYYLHHPDLARGTGHFRLSLAEGLDLVAAAEGRRSMPRYVLDLPGGHGKVPVSEGLSLGGGRYRFSAFHGGAVDYRDPSWSAPRPPLPHAVHPARVRAVSNRGAASP